MNKEEKSIPKKEAHSSEIKFLEGPQSRWEDLKFTVKVFREFIRGFRSLHFVGPCICIFGSARIPEEHPYYQQTRELAGAIARVGFTIMTGGGPGLMEAANKGAKEVGGKSVGCNIILPFEQYPNRYLDKWVNLRYFFVRKTMLIKYSYAFVVMPGGFGTLDEFFEALTLIQTQKIKEFPVIVFCKDFHARLIEYIEVLKDEGMISPLDTNLIFYTDSIDDAVNHIRTNSIDQFGLKYIERKPHWFLREKKFRTTAYSS